MDSGDLGTLVGAIFGGAVTAATGVGLPVVIAGSAVGALGGHHIAEPNHYKQIYQNNQYK